MVSALVSLLVGGCVGRRFVEWERFGYGLLNAETVEKSCGRALPYPRRSAWYRQTDSSVKGALGVKVKLTYLGRNKMPADILAKALEELSDQLIEIRPWGGATTFLDGTRGSVGLA
uniref:Uncharacterized protein n=1 Tax=Rhodosorus marinus TaxID=101924 RepID=A0A7S0G978_9RHOD|mmetsp:Transcript_8389/g.12376  ORF Transcript_8389/g.12376 Transcript_8389/m.12376 type:complete len:116 (+) Transcript_8389:100-447(+)